jgi:hypothetical protein
MAVDSLWEASFREFLLSHCGRELIEKSYNSSTDRHDNSSTNQHDNSSTDRTIFSVFFNGLTIADSCSVMLIYLKTSPAKTISRCHQILTEVGRKVLEEKHVKAAQTMVRFQNYSNR